MYLSGGHISDFEYFDSMQHDATDLKVPRIVRGDPINTDLHCAALIVADPVMSALQY